jgi:hypothetical protein
MIVLQGFRKNIVSLALFLGVLVVGIPFSQAQETFTGQSSTVVLILAPEKKMPKLRVYLEGQLHLQAREGQSAFERSLLWAGLGYAVTPKTTLFAAHGWTPNYNPEFINEQRSFQQVLHIEKVKGGLLFLRGRLEERFIPNESTPLFWTRFMARYQRNFQKHPKFYWVVQNEVLFNANTISKANRRGFGQALSFVGLGRHITPHIMAELGYGALYLHSSKGFLEHMLMLTVFYFP